MVPLKCQKNWLRFEFFDENSSPKDLYTLTLLSDQMSEAEREALDDQQQQTGQHQVLNLKGKKMFFIYVHVLTKE